jgi:hypothetical protein
MAEDASLDFETFAVDEQVLGVQPDLSSLREPSKSTRAKQGLHAKLPQSSGLEEIAQYGGYPTYHPPGNTDPWVRTTLKKIFPDQYHDIYGFTRRGRGLPGLYDALEKYNTNVAYHADLNVYQRTAMRHAISKARAAFKLPVKYQPLDWREVGFHMKTQTSAGVTFPGLSKSECMEQIYTEARWLGHRMKQGGKMKFDPTKVRFPPCLAGQRGHMSPIEEAKTRLVWIYPAEMLVVEGLYAPVIYEKLASLPDGPLLLGSASHRLYMRWLGRFRDGESLHGLDFSSFDTGVPPWLIRVAFDIIRQNVDWLNWRGKPTTKRTRQKWRNVWDGMIWYFINTPILMPDGRMFRKHHGVPSGSYWTQLVDSVVCYILNNYLAECQGVEPQGLKVLGDDSVFRAAHRLDLSQAQSDADCVRMRLKVEKCELTEDPSEFKLLGTRYRHGHPYRDDSEWFKHALYPENVPPDIQVSMSRLVGLWLAGGMWSRKFCEFFHYFQSCYECPNYGWFSKDQRKWLEVLYGGKSPRGWTNKRSLYWSSIFYTL